MILSLAILTTALLFGGMTLFAFAFAAFLFTALPIDVARSVIRKAFPWFYLFVIAVAGAGALLWWPHDPTSSVLMAAIGLTTVPTRQVLMPAINRATDAQARGRFKALHGLSVLVTLAHIAAAGWVLARLA